MTRPTRRRPVIGCCAAVCVSALAGVAAAAAADGQYPTKPVRLVIPFPPGGTTDIVARIFAEQMQLALRQSFITDNRGGASTNIGMEIVARAPADGYTLLANTAPLVVNPALFASLPFDPMKDFVPVALLSQQPNVLTIGPSLPVQSVAELIERARAKPGTIKYATSGSGTNSHLGMVLLATQAKIDLVHIPYRGTAPALQALLGGEIEMMFYTVPAVGALIKSGKLHAIGVSSARPAATLPGVAPIGATVPGYEASAWVAVVAPARTPAAVIARLNAENERMLSRSDVRDRLAALGTEPGGGSPKAVADHLAAEAKKWQRIVRIAGVKAE